MGIRQKKVRVLIVDDSQVVREVLKRALSLDHGIEVVGTAGDPFVARDLILSHDPDVITLDIEMPKMDGIKFLQKLMPQYPIPVVVVSALSERVFEALDAGAVDFITKPDLGDPSVLNSFYAELILKIKIASTAKIKMFNNTLVRNSSKKVPFKSDIIIAMGASTGGTEATAQILRSLPREMPPILITQHMPAGFTDMYAKRLNSLSQLEVAEARHGDPVLPNRVLIAPGSMHMRLEVGPSGYYVSCKPGDKVNGHCPSVDVLFNSVAEKAGKKAVGVILTGMGSDGAHGLLNMKTKGAYTLGQDRESSVVYGMPMVAQEIGAVTEQVSIDKMAEHIIKAVEHISK